MFFLYHRKTKPTGKLLADALGLLSGKLPPATGALLRWGSQVGWETDQNRACVLNPVKGLVTASDKLVAFQAMREAGVPVPPFGPNPHDAGTYHGDNEIVIGRTRKGFKGQGITVYRNQYPGAHELYVAYIPNDREYRIHVVGNEVIRVQRKYLEVPEARRSDFIKNHANGYRFKTPARRLKPDREEAAVNAVKACGLDFGAVDLIVDHNDVCWVLEVNTAPSCSPKTAAAYIGAFARLIEQRTGRQMVVDFNGLDLFGAHAVQGDE